MVPLVGRRHVCPQIVQLMVFLFRPGLVNVLAPKDNQGSRRERRHVKIPNLGTHEIERVGGHIVIGLGSVVMHAA